MWIILWATRLLEYSAIFDMIVIVFGLFMLNVLLPMAALGVFVPHAQLRLYLKLPLLHNVKPILLISEF